MLGNEHPKITDTRRLLASLLYSMGQTEEAALLEEEEAARQDEQDQCRQNPQPSADES